MSGKTSMSTKLIHGGVGIDPYTGAVGIPVYFASTYKQDDLGVMRAGFEYARSGNPTRAAAEALIADLEGGVAGFAFPSGMAAITTVLSLFQSGDRILLSQNIYGGTYRILESVFSKFGISYTIADMRSRASLEAAITQDAKAILIETPTNPLLDVTDLQLVADFARERGLVTIVDNTFMTPYLQRPLEFGIDIVLHSATKYLGGHSDLVAGLAVARTKELSERIAFLQNTQGAVLPPFDCFLLMRGMRTLGVRMDRHVQNAEAVAQSLAENPSVRSLRYPGLPSDPGYAVQNRQARNGGAMIAFELGEDVDLRGFFQALEVVLLAESLGGVESLICHPATMTHAAVPADVRKMMGISDRLIRLSVGIEDAADLIHDLNNAIDRARR